MPALEFDYIIVGAGSAGCVLANRLSAEPQRRVLLVESGPADRHPFIHIPRAVPKLLAPGSDYISIHEVSPGGNRANTFWVKGRGLGGSSSVNGMIYVRGHPADYDGWEALGCRGWGWDEMARCFAVLEQELGVTVHPSGEALCEAILAAAGQAGTPRVLNINDAPDGGFGYQPCTIRKGRRQSAARAFLKPVAHRANLTVLTGTDALRLVFEDRRVTGIVLRGKDGEFQACARREVILSAGAIASPALLQRSGIGDGSLLRSLGIPLVADAPEVGRNLQEHFNYKAKHRVRSGSLNAQFHGLRLVANMARYMLLHSGPMTRSVWEAGGFVKTRPGLPKPDAQIGVGLYSIAADGGTDRFPGLCFSGYTVNPRSRGSLTLVSPDPAAPPRIDANFLGHVEDQRDAVALLRYIRSICAQPALRDFIAEEIVPGPEVESDEDALEAFIKFASTAFHVCGTCRMGGDAASVVDPQLKVRGVEGLRVVDTSIFPTLVSGNTNAPAMALALRAAELILGA